MAQYDAKVDVRDYERPDKYPTVHKTFGQLKVGEKMELINDHDFRRLFEVKFSQDYPDQFEWHYLEKGPGVWRASVEKIK